MYPRKMLFSRLFFLVLISVCHVVVFGQTTVVTGRITDSRTGEPLAFASISFKGTSIGTTTDFDGYYKLKTSLQVDSIVFVYVGFKKAVIAVKAGQEQEINISAIPSVNVLKGVVVTVSGNPAIPIIKKAQRNKEQYDYEKIKSYECESFTKVQLAINNVSEEFKKNKLVKHVGGIFDTISQFGNDSGRQVLPIFISETISDFYFNKSPLKQKEVIKAASIKGVGVEDGSFLSQLLGSTFQQYNFNSNILVILEKNFISPISTHSFLYYNYELIGTEFVDSHFLYKIKVAPKNSLDLVFSGFIWVEDSTYALKKLSLEVTNKANLNFVEKLKITQELAATADGAYMPVKTRVLVDIAQLTPKSAGLIAQFYVSKKNFKVNQTYDSKFFDYPLVVQDGANNRKDTYWDSFRHDVVTKEDVRIRNKIDTLTNVPVIKTYVEIIDIIFNGYKSIGKIDFGPYALLYGYNNLEGSRFRFGAKTNATFSKKVVLSGYVAYGIKDDRFKYKIQSEYILSRRKWTTVGLLRREDVDQIGVTDDVYGSNLFSAVSIFAANQLNRTKENKFWLKSEVKKGWNFGVTFHHKYFGFQSINDFNFYYYQNRADSVISNSFTNATLTIDFRYAPKDYYLQNDNERVRMKEPGALALFAQYVRGFKGVFGSNFDYNKIKVGIEKGISFGYWGRTDITLTGTKIFEALPYPILDVHRGNQSFILNSSAFNLMNFFEFVTDENVTLHIEHHFDGALFNRIPLLKKLKWREFVETKAVMGRISNANLSLLPDFDKEGRSVSRFNRVDKEPYVEFAYGVENIFKLFKLGFIHRITHLENTNARAFGVKLGMYFSF